MKKSRFSEEQFIGILREQEAGGKTTAVCRRHAISTTTLYAWKAKFGGLDVSGAKRLRRLEDENAKLKRLLADAMLDNVALKDLISEKMVTPVARRELPAHLVTTHGMSERRACLTLSIDRLGSVIASSRSRSTILARSFCLGQRAASTLFSTSGCSGDPGQKK
jgi:putative transposase